MERSGTPEYLPLRAGIRAAWRPGRWQEHRLEREQSATPRAELVTARDFRTIYGDALSPQTETLFIDGLDEARAGGDDPRGPFDQIRTRLRQLTPKRVRISCRELDWLGENDRTNLSKVVPGGEVIVLRLEPLNADEQRRIIGPDPRIRGPHRFPHRGRRTGNREPAHERPDALAPRPRGRRKRGLPGGPCRNVRAKHVGCSPGSRTTNTESPHRYPNPRTLSMQPPATCAPSAFFPDPRFLLAERARSGWVRAHLAVRRHRQCATPNAPLTRVSSPASGTGRFVPVHANIAAFLAAQHLARAGGRSGAGRPHPGTAHRN